MHNFYLTMTKTFDYADCLRDWSDTASVKELLDVLATKKVTNDDWRAMYFESCVDLEQNGAEAVSGFKDWLQWKFRCKVATSDNTELECLCWKVVNKTKTNA